MRYLTYSFTGGNVTEEDVEEFMSQFSPWGRRVMQGFFWYKTNLLGLLSRQIDAVDSDMADGYKGFLEMIDEFQALVDSYEEALTSNLAKQENEEEYNDSDGFEFGADQGYAGLLIWLDYARTSLVPRMSKEEGRFASRFLDKLQDDITETLGVLPGD